MRYLRLFFLLIVILLLTACSDDSASEQSPLDPEQPISITLWHYHIGQTKKVFDELVEEFNHTVGLEQGIVVDAQSQGDIHQLENAVFNAANKEIGAARIPDIFGAYPENAYRVNKLIELVDFHDYFSAEELEAYHPDFLKSGYFMNDDALYVLPVAASTENLFLNKTVWEQFATASGRQLDELTTWDGIVEVSADYYDWSDGKAFLGIDSLTSFMFVTAEQLGESFYQMNDGQLKIQLDRDVAKRIWDTYYIPFIKGHYIAEGYYSSDDLKVGLNIGYIGSTAGANYFPTEVLYNGNILPIENETLPYPVHEGGEPVAIQQGAGMVVTKSDTAHEYAAVQFLKWFTSQEQNRQFAIATGYFPVKKDALGSELLTTLQEQNPTASPALQSSIQTTLDMYEQYKLLSFQAFGGSFDIRNLLADHLATRVKQDLAILANDPAKQATFQDDAHFDEWYSDFINELAAFKVSP